MEELAEDYGTIALVLLEYWVRPDYSSGDSYARFKEYSLRYTPTACFNRPENQLVGAASYSEFKAAVDSERAQDSSIEITAETSVSGQEITVSAKVTNKEDEALEQVEVIFVAYEDLGESKKHHVVRDKQSVGTISSLSSGESQSFSQSIQLSGADMSKVEVAVCLQSTASSLEVLQVALA